MDVLLFTPSFVFFAMGVYHQSKGQPVLANMYFGEFFPMAIILGIILKIIFNGVFT